MCNNVIVITVRYNVPEPSSSLFNLFTSSHKLTLQSEVSKVGIKLLKLSHATMFSHSKILFLVPLLFVTSIPTYFLNF